MKVFLGLAERSMMGFTANFLVSILPCVAYDAQKNRILATCSNSYIHVHVRSPFLKTEVVKNHFTVYYRRAADYIVVLFAQTGSLKFREIDQCSLYCCYV